jgi:hypothetical protein
VSIYNTKKLTDVMADLRDVNDLLEEAEKAVQLSRRATKFALAPHARLAVTPCLLQLVAGQPGQPGRSKRLFFLINPDDTDVWKRTREYDPKSCASNFTC